MDVARGPGGEAAGRAPQDSDRKHGRLRRDGDTFTDVQTSHAAISSSSFDKRVGGQQKGAYRHLLYGAVRHHYSIKWMIQVFPRDTEIKRSLSLLISTSNKTPLVRYLPVSISAKASYLSLS